MDKVKIVLAGLKKYHFWVLCLLVIVFGVVVWNIATADLTNQFTKGKGTLDSALQSARSISGETDHPNEKTNQALAERNAAQRQMVLDGWKTLYEKQKKENPWPKPPILSQKFLDHVKSRKPDQEIKVQYREMYSNFIRRYIPTLFEIVDYRHPEEIKDDDNGGNAVAKKQPAVGIGGGMAGMGAGMGNTQYRMVGIVDWDQSDRDRILQRFYWRSSPTTIQLRMAQEDIWVYEALLKIIKATNEGATSHHNAAIKQIAALEIGQFAAGSVASGGANLAAAVTGAAGGGAGAGMGGGMGGPGMGMGEPGMGMGGPGMGMGGPGMGMGAPGMGGPGMGGPGMGMGGGMGGPGMGGGGMGGPGMGMGGEMGMGGPGMGMGGDMGMGMGGAPALKPEDEKVLNGRYVDQNKKPIMATAEHPYAEFKMMPIRMSILMDQRKIPKLLVECANSTMPVEVQRIRINPQGGLSASSGAGGGMGMGMGMEGGMGGPGMGGPGRGGPGMGGPGMGGLKRGGPGMGMEGGMMGGGMGGMMGGGSQAEEVNLQEVPVEIVGIIYIYNPPDIAKVGTGTAQDEATGMPSAAGLPGGTPATPAATMPATTQPETAPGTTPPAAVPPGAAATPAVPPAATPPAATPPVATPPVATPPVATPPVATPPAGAPAAAPPGN